MAILDKSKTSFINDNDENIFIGLENAFIMGEPEGWFKSTKTTIASIKENLKAIINTEKGERLMQPNIGMNLRAKLFNPIDVELNVLIEEEIVATIGKYFPFVNITELTVTTADPSKDEYGSDTIKIHIGFMINNNPNLLDSVDIELEGES
tara:strand:+ start:118 stop:570 length:453 start_codon:yes stop_codon:yes gene_type:complete